MKNRHKIKLRIAGISALILSLIIGTWPVIVRAAEDTTWQNDFDFALDDAAFKLDGEDHNIVLNRYMFPNRGETELVIPKYAIIGGVSYRTCLGNYYISGVFETWDGNPSPMRRLDLSNVDTSKTSDMRRLFRNGPWNEIVLGDQLDTSNVTNMSQMFENCDNLISLDLSTLNTRSVTNMSSMFRDCNNLNSLDLSALDTSSVTQMVRMFANCENLTHLNLTDFETHHVIDMDYMFAGCINLPSLNLSSFNTSSVGRMVGMFYNCSSLKALDLRSFDTGKVRFFREMFSGCTGLERLNTESFTVTGIEWSNSIAYWDQCLHSMFKDCSSLISLDLSGMDFSHLNYFGWYQPHHFFENTNLEEIKSPINHRAIIELPFQYRAVETGEIFDRLPRDRDVSLTLRRYDPTVVENVSLNETSHEMTDADTFQLIATVSPDTAVDKSVTWSSSDTGIVTVDDTGLVTGIAPGEADVTVTTTDGGHTATCHFTITHAPVPVTGISVSPSTLTLTAGDTATLTATVEPSNADDKSVSWSSSDGSIATVSDSGVVTAVAPGTAVITVTSTNGGYTADCRVTVTPSAVPVSGISLSPDTLTMTVGDTENLTVSITPDNAGNKNVTFTSNNTSVATVDTNGVVTAVAPGGAAITATTEDGSHSDTSLVIVSERTTPVVDVSGVTLMPETLSMVVGETEPLTATVMPANATNKNVSYTSSDPSVATVDANGVVTAVSPGNTTVTVTTADGNKTDTCLVTVTAAPTPVSDVSLNHDTLSMTVGDTETLTATVRPANATNKNVTYTSSDPAVATVDANGVVTALSPGTTTITVTTQDGNKTDTCLVTVAPAQNGQLLTVIDRRTDAEHTDKTAAAVTSLTEPLTLTITTTDGTALRSALPAEDEIDQVSTFRLNMTDASGNPASSYGNCTVIMPLPMNFITDSGKLKLYYTNANGVLETIENISVSTSPEGVRTISFQAPEMTEYALVHSKKETTPVNPDDGGGNNPPENNDPVQPVVNVNVPTPEVTVNVPPPEVIVNVPAPQVTANIPDASGNPSGTAMNTQGTATNSTPSGTGAVASANAGDMPRTGNPLPYRMMVVTMLFIAGIILILLSLEPKKRWLPE